MSGNCWSCGKEGEFERGMCPAPKCQHYLIEMDWELDQEYRQRKWNGFRRAFIHRCKIEQNWSLHRAARWFYTVKALMCLLLDRREPAGLQYPDKIEVAEIDFHWLYAGWSQDILSVGHGVFRQWWYSLDHDYDWNM